MYITIERNNRGKLEISDEILTKLIKYNVLDNVKDLKEKDVEVSVAIAYDLIDYILISFKIDELNKNNIDEEYLRMLINNTLKKLLSSIPKNISFGYIKKITK